MKVMLYYLIQLVFCPIVIGIWLLIKLGDFIKMLDDLEKHLQKEITER